MQLGEGLAGFAFSKVKTITYCVREENPAGYFITDAELGWPPNPSRQPQAVICLPWVFSDSVLCGVVNVGSCRAGTQLLQLCENQGASERLGKLNLLTNAAANSILEEGRRFYAAKMGS